MHKYIMHKISTPEIWLKYKSFFVCFYFFFWRLMDRAFGFRKLENNLREGEEF